MKKFLITVLSVIVGASGLISILDNNDNNIFRENLSEVRYNLFGGQTDSFSATFMTGEREDPYVINGIAKELIEFGVLRLHFKIDTESFFGMPTYKLTINDVFYEGEFKQNPFDKSYVTDINVRVADDSDIYLLVEWGDLYETLKLNSISSSWEYDWEKALKLAVSKISESTINRLKSNGVTQIEVHVKIVGDPSGFSDQYYWYVTVYAANGSKITTVIDPLTGEIISKKTVTY